MSRTTLLVALVVFSACTAPPAEAPPEEAAPSQTIQSLRDVHNARKAMVLEAARNMSDETFAYRPSERHMSSAAVLAHIAAAQQTFCSAAAGQPMDMSEEYAETEHTKAEILANLEASFSQCDALLADLTDESGGQIVSIFGERMAVTLVLAFNAAHNYEHYADLLEHTEMTAEGM